MATVNRTKSIDMTNPLERSKSPDSTAPITPLERMNKTLAELKDRVQILEDRCDRMMLLNAIRRELDNLTIFFKGKNSIVRNEDDANRVIHRIDKFLHVDDQFTLRIQGHCNSLFFNNKGKESRIATERAEEVRKRIIKSIPFKSEKRNTIPDRLEIVDLGSTQAHFKGIKLDNSRVTFAIPEDLILEPSDLSNPLPDDEEVNSTGSNDTVDEKRGEYNKLKNKV